jgi:hypothetical protein
MAQQPGLPQRLPLVLQPENRQEETDKDAKLINGYMEKGVNQGEYWLYKRPGLLQTGATITGNGYGVYNWLGDIYSIFGQTIYKNGTAIAGGAPNGALDNTGGVYRFSSCLGATPALQFGNGVGSYNYDGSTPFAAISGANFPASGLKKGWAYLDGTTYVVNSAANIRGCTNLNAPTVWTDVLNTITAQIEPDGGIFLSKQLVYVVAFKQWTTEVFYDAANATGSPLSPVQGAKINYGCASQDSVQELDGVLLWAATNRSSAVQVVMMDSLKVQVVSTKPIERILGEADFSAVYSLGIKYEGHRFYVLTLKNNNITLVYDMTDGLWSQWTDPNGNYFKIVSSTFLANTGRILQHETNGKLYLMDSEYTNDDGSVITVDMYTPNFDAGVKNKKHLTKMRFIGDQTAGSILQVRCNDNDYDATKWTNFRKVDLGVRDPYLTNCGSFRRRAHHFRHTANTRLRIQAIELQMDVGTL